MSKKNFLYKNFQKKFFLKKDIKKIIKILKKVVVENNEIIKSLAMTIEIVIKKKQLSKYKKKFQNFRVIGMGGSILGTKAIYDFLKHKIKKKFTFIDNLHHTNFNKEKNFLNLIVSKSGNTLETIVNANILIKKKNKNIFITENKKNYIQILAKKLKSEVIYHNNFIGGRYSVLSEVGMLPAELMGLNVNRFKQLNSLITNKSFFNSLVNNVASTFFLLKKKKLIQ